MTLEAWRAMRAPKSVWRRSARRAIRAVVDVYGDALDGTPELLVAVDAAYPFGERKYTPYKDWLTERRLLIEALKELPTLPTKDEADACEVARDMLLDEVPLQPGSTRLTVDEVIAMLDREAPNRLARKCPACGAKPGRPCRDLTIETLDLTLPAMGAADMIVPHHARLVGHLDAGPLFRGQDAP